MVESVQIPARHAAWRGQHTAVATATGVLGAGHGPRACRHDQGCQPSAGQSAGDHPCMLKTHRINIGQDRKNENTDQLYVPNLS